MMGLMGSGTGSRLGVVPVDFRLSRLGAQSGQPNGPVLGIEMLLSAPALQGQCVSLRLGFQPRQIALELGDAGAFLEVLTLVVVQGGDEGGYKRIAGDWKRRCVHQRRLWPFYATAAS